MGKAEIKKNTIKTYRDLNVYQQAYESAMNIFELSKEFPKEEKYSLTDQIRRSSRSIPANIVEGWAKRKYENVFLKHLNDANGSCEETKVWLNFAEDCKYLEKDKHTELFEQYNQIGAMLNSLVKKWNKF
jgi:four helix bundle protein